MNRPIPSSGSGFVYSVESTAAESGRVSISLVRSLPRASGRRFHVHAEEVEQTALFSQSFRPMLDQIAIAAYTRQLSLIARYAQEGTFGCFVQTRDEGGNVEIRLYERWFDGHDIHTEVLAEREYDAGDEASLVASAEFLADLSLWAERRNQEREAAYLSDSAADATRRALAADREAAGRELNEILAAHANSD